MSILRPFEATDILHFNSVNADAWTATYGCHYYSQYVATWPEMCMVAESAFEAGPSIKAYMIGKDEPPPPNPQHHAHLTAMSITPSYRSLGLARLFMDHLESQASDGSTAIELEEGAEQNGEADLAKRKDCVDAWFVDLFVRCNNHRAIEMYERLGYSVYRRVVDYYHGMEGPDSTRDELDGFDMRKSTARDTLKKQAKRYVRKNGRDIHVTPDQVWQ